MGNLIFLPWTKCQESFQIGEFYFIPYVRAKLPFPDDVKNQKLIDDILSSYRAHANKPIEKSTIISIHDQDILKDLKDEDFTKIYNFSELFTLSNLSARKFFDSLGDVYCNKDAFQMIIQGFRSDQDYHGSLITKRQKDGYRSTYYHKDALFVNKPGYIVCPRIMTIDVELLVALLNAQEKMNSKDWNAIYESIISFNLSNKDSDDISENIEIVMLNSAIERLLEANGNEDVLSKKFTNILQPEHNINKDNCELFKQEQSERFKKVKYVRDLWIRDLFRIRNNIAHGKIATNYPAIFSIKNHLLLSSFIYPIILKLVLNHYDYYNLSKDDRISINVFERLVCREHFLYKNDTGADITTPPWQEVFADEIFKGIFE
jgi:hypothetical protein